MKILILETAFSTSGIHRKISNIVKKFDTTNEKNRSVHYVVYYSNFLNL